MLNRLLTTVRRDDAYIFGTQHQPDTAVYDHIRRRLTKDDERCISSQDPQRPIGWPRAFCMDMQDPTVIQILAHDPERSHAIFSTESKWTFAEMSKLRIVGFLEV